MSLSVETGEVATPRLITLDDAEARRVMVVMSLAYALLSCSLSAQVALPEIRRTIRMTDVVTSLHGSFFGWALLIGGLFFAKLSSSIGRARFLAAGVVGLCAGATLFATGHVVAQTLAGAALSGVSGAILVITIPGLVADAFGERRSEVFTKLNAMPALAGLLFPLAVAAAPSVSLTWRWPTIVFPVVLTTAMVVLTRTLHNRERAPKATADIGAWSVLEPLKIKAVRKRFALQILSTSIEFAAGLWMVTYLREIVGLSRDRAPVGAAGWALGMLVARSMVPRMITWFGPKLEMMGFAGVAVGGLILMYGHVTIIRCLAVPMISFSIGPMYTLGVERLFIRGGANPKNTGTLSSLAAVASGAAITAGPLLVGLAGDAVGLRNALWLVPIGAGVGVLLSAMQWGGEAGRLGQP